MHASKKSKFLPLKHVILRLNVTQEEGVEGALRWHMEPMISSTIVHAW